MKEISILIGGKAGDGIKKAGHTIARLLNQLGYRIFLYNEYPSLVKGGHNFNVIRGADKKIRAHRTNLDIIVALNQETVEKHKDDLISGGVILYDSDEVETEGTGIPFTGIVKDLEGISVMRNTAAIGALAKTLDIEWSVVDKLLAGIIEEETDLNIKIAQKAYTIINKPHLSLIQLDMAPQPLLTGNQAIGLGAVQGGLNMYIAYPMTPSSGILHFLAENEHDLGIVTFQPENEIAVALMALGAAYAGARTMVGTSGGGFALMTEAVSLAGEAEIPIVFVEAQRAGASTGVPTYTAQGDLLFVLHAGHGDFLKLVVAPGDVEEALELTALAMKLAWKYQTPAFILSDKHLSESIFSFDSETGERNSIKPLLWDGRGEYRRYEDSKEGISPLAFPGNPDAVVKVSSNEHNHSGFTTQDPYMVEGIQKKRLRKQKGLIEELSQYEQVKVYGRNDSKTAAICWGSTKGACMEAVEELDIKMVQPLIMEPFPVDQLNMVLSGVEKIINVEINATGQLGKILASHGVNVNRNILRFDARPFTVDSLVQQIKEVL